MFLRWGVVSAPPNPQAGVLPLVGCPQLRIRYIRSYPPYWRPFLHPQPKDAPCRGDKEPLITAVAVILILTKMEMLWTAQLPNTTVSGSSLYWTCMFITTGPNPDPFSTVYILRMNILTLYFIMLYSSKKQTPAFYSEDSGSDLNMVIGQAERDF